MFINNILNASPFVECRGACERVTGQWTGLEGRAGGTEDLALPMVAIAEKKTRNKRTRLKSFTDLPLPNVIRHFRIQITDGVIQRFS